MTDKSRWRGGLLLLLCLTGTPVAADEDYDAARRLQQQHEILPLETLLERLELAPDDRLLEAELEHEDAGWLYELEVLGADGRVREYEIDAATGEVLRTEEE